MVSGTGVDGGQARFTLPPEPTRLLLVTNGHWVPVKLFDGEVRPIDEG